MGTPISLSLIGLYTVYILVCVADFSIKCAGRHMEYKYIAMRVWWKRLYIFFVGSMVVINFKSLYKGLKRTTERAFSRLSAIG